MKELHVIIKDPLGLHARPAGQLVKLASGYECSITVVKDKKSVDAKKLFSVMSLGAKQGEKLIIQFDGADEKIAADKMENFVTSGL